MLAYLTTTLASYDAKLPVGLACDASGNGVGACLFHIGGDGKERVIVYASKSLTPAVKNYSQVEKEGPVNGFWHAQIPSYLLGRKFILRTDHRPLLTISDATKVSSPTRISSRLTRWALQLSQYDYQIQFTKPSEHRNADALSALSKIASGRRLAI